MQKTSFCSSHNSFRVHLSASINLDGSFQAELAELEAFATECAVHNGLWRDIDGMYSFPVHQDEENTGFWLTVDDPFNVTSYSFKIRNTDERSKGEFVSAANVVAGYLSAWLKTISEDAPDRWPEEPEARVAALAEALSDGPWCRLLSDDRCENHGDAELTIYLCDGSKLFLTPEGPSLFRKGHYHDASSASSSYTTHELRFVQAAGHA